MSHWNYRVVKQTSPMGEDYWGIHEVYYSDEGKPQMRTEEAVGVSSADGPDGVDSLRKILSLMTEALSKPVLTDEEIGDAVKVGQ